MRNIKLIVAFVALAGLSGSVVRAEETSAAVAAAVANTGEVNVAAPDDKKDDEKKDDDKHKEDNDNDETAHAMADDADDQESAEAPDEGESPEAPQDGETADSPSYVRRIGKGVVNAGRGAIGKGIGKAQTGAAAGRRVIGKGKGGKGRAYPAPPPPAPNPGQQPNNEGTRQPANDQSSSSSWTSTRPGAPQRPGFQNGGRIGGGNSNSGAPPAARPTPWKAGSRRTKGGYPSAQSNTVQTPQGPGNQPCATAGMRRTFSSGGATMTVNGCDVTYSSGEGMEAMAANQGQAVNIGYASNGPNGPVHSGYVASSGAQNTAARTTSN